MQLSLGVSVVSTLRRPLIAAWASSFLERYPDIKLELSVTDRRVDLIRESFDIAVGLKTQTNTSLISCSLGVLAQVCPRSHRRSISSSSARPGRSRTSR